MSVRGTTSPPGTSSPYAGTDLAGVVLAAGLGTRLRPLTDLRPKALCPVAGVALVDLALDRLAPQVGTVPVAPSDPLCSARTGSGPVAARSGGAVKLVGSTHMAVNAHHHAEQVVEHVGARAHVSVEQPEPLGTAGALGRLRAWLDGRDVLLTNADAYLPDGLGDLLPGWDGERCRLLVRQLPAGVPGDFERGSTPLRYVGACLLPWRLVRELTDEPSGLYEVLWQREDEAGRLDLAVTRGTSIDCGTPADYLAANLHSSGGETVIGEGAVVQGRLDRCVVWDGAYVGPGERLVRVVRAGTREQPVTVDCR